MNIVKNIKLRNFRSHEAFDFEFNKKTTIIAGENGCGKTDEAAKYVNEMHTIADTTEEFEMKPVYDYLLSLDENSFK